MSLRVCTKCHEEKPLTEFYKKARLKLDGSPDYFTICKVCTRKYHSDYRAERRPHRNKIEREAKQRTMLNALQKLSPDGVPKCAVCGFSADIRLLQIDHKHDNGSKDRTNSGHKRTGSLLQAKVMKMTIEEARAEYQVLCVAHNWIKRFGVDGSEYALVKRSGKPTTIRD